MAKVSLSISGVSEGMSSQEVRQKLAQLYNKPEQQFEKLCQSLFIMQQPFVLLKDVEQDLADKHAARLTALGFTCDFGDGGLTLVPTSERAGAAACCPACSQPCGDDDLCSHCGVYMKKYLEQKKLDEKLQKQLQSASNSHERIQKFQAEQAAKQKEEALAKQQAKLEKKQKQKQKSSEPDPEPEETHATADEVSEFKAKYKEKRNLALPAAFAATAIVVGGGGYFGHDYITNRYVSDAPPVTANLAVEVNPEVAAAAPVASVTTNAITVATTDSVEEIEATLFDEWIDRKREKQALKKQISELMEEKMTSSATGLVAGKTDPRDQIFGRQELIKLQGQGEKTDRRLLNTYMLVLALEDDAERVDATLNQSSIYRLFDRHEEATKTYDQAAKIAASIEDAEHRIISETALAEHHVEQSNLDGARARYQAAKDRTGELPASHPPLKSAALAYISASEVAYGLTADAEKTADQITDQEIRQESLQMVTDIAAQNEVNGVPELAAANRGEEAGGTGDELIDDLIKMNEQNRKKLKAASSLLGQ